MDNDQLEHTVKIVTELVDQWRSQRESHPASGENEISIDESLTQTVNNIPYQHLIDERVPLRYQLAKALIEKEGWRILALHGPKGIQQVMLAVDEEIEDILQYRWNILPSMGAV